ncbi:MAG TPA: pyridoxamine 5'-phosphate oxidase family protein [Mycobacteriales bacterium]|nr:pyridoxamine 5'-phosphate oxidase family protein [Mycobacteriales bacterium]
MNTSETSADSATCGVMYGTGARGLQDAFDSRRLADRLDSLTVHDTLTDDDRDLIARQSFFLLATVGADGWPDVSYKGGAPGFVRAVDEHTICFPSYDGNGMFRSLGNIEDDGRVALLFVDLEKPWRLRVHGVAGLATDEEATSNFPGALAVVTVRVGRAFPNCGRYIHDFASGTLSRHVPAQGYTPPVPDWKKSREIAPYLPADQLSD